jgi:hypothetical protein
VRGIYPIIATVDASGFSRLADDEVAERFAAILARRGQSATGGDGR